jgi:predicted DNA-binding WGR domain protein
MTLLFFSLAVQKHNPTTHWGRHNIKADMKRMRDPELATVDQIVKKRLRLEKSKRVQQDNRNKNIQNRKKHVAKQKNKK